MSDTYGCNNSIRQDGYYVGVGKAIVGSGETKTIRPLAMYYRDLSSRECRYDQRANDARCQGCKK